MRYFLLLLSLILLSCQTKKSESTDKKTTPSEVADQKEEQKMQSKGFKPAPGGYYIKAAVPADAAANRLLSIIDNNQQVGLVAHFEHHKMAQQKGLALETTHAIYFGNPQLGTPLLQKDQLLGLDLPQKIITFDSGDNSYLYRLSTTYLSDRYDVSFSDLSTMTKTLDGLCQNIAGNNKRQMESPSIDKHEGIIVKHSNLSFDDAVKAVQEQIKSAQQLDILAELDHQENAASVDMDLRPTHVIMFGNPQVGISLMQANRSIAVELPLKILIFENEQGQVKLAHKDMEFLLDRYQVNIQKDHGKKMNQIMAKLMANAI
ncbi:MAG: DUF302 domain-containing protein [Psychroflexus sp.]|nr:DUF302 domain-containing protein [Psychroflexus sp.]